MPGDLDAVLFDLDGTLLDHGAAVRAALSSWFPSIGVEQIKAPGLTRLWLDLEQRHYPSYQRREITFQEQRRRRLRDFLPSTATAVVESKLDELFAAYLCEYERNWTAFADAEDAMTRARQAGLLVGVLTNGDQDQQVAKLSATRLLGLTDAVFASSALGAARPEPEAFLRACSRLHVEPGRTLMVGDDYAIDVSGARAAGLNATHIDRGAPPRHGSLTRLTDLAFQTTNRTGDVHPE